MFKILQKEKKMQENVNKTYLKYSLVFRYSKLNTLLF